MRDGVVAVDAEGDEHVRGRVGDHDLEEPDDFAGNVARLPGDRHPPDNVREDADQAHREICNRESEMSLKKKKRYRITC